MLLLASLIFATQDRANCTASDSAELCLEAGLHRSYVGGSNGLESYALACKKGNAQGCFFEQLERYTAGDSSLALGADAAAFTELQSRCSVGSAAACYHQGVLHVDGPMDYRDSSQGNMLLRQACDGAVYEACLMLAEPFARSTEPATKAQALDLYRKGCDAGHAKSCLALLSQIDAGSEEALKVGAQACKAGAESACK